MVVSFLWKCVLHFQRNVPFTWFLCHSAEVWHFLLETKSMAMVEVVLWWKTHGSVGQGVTSTSFTKPSTDPGTSTGDLRSLHAVGDHLNSGTIPQIPPPPPKKKKNTPEVIIYKRWKSNKGKVNLAYNSHSKHTLLSIIIIGYPIILVVFFTRIYFLVF